MAVGFKKPVDVQMQTTAINTAYLAQDCQRRQSQASIEPVCVTLCFLVKNMLVWFSVRCGYAFESGSLLEATIQLYHRNPFRV